MTVTVIDTLQLPYPHTIVTVPGLTPVTIPDEEPTVAMAVLLLLHVTPETVLLRVVVWPTQTVGLPVMAAGAALTVTSTVAEQPELPVYTMVEIPVATPVTTPVSEPTVALEPTPVEDHRPLGVASVIVTDEPKQIVVGPVIGAGSGSIFIVEDISEVVKQPDGIV